MKKYTYVSVIYDDDIVAKTINEPSFYYQTDLEDIDIDDKVLVNRNGNEFFVYRVDGWMYPSKTEKPENKITLAETANQFPKWLEAWEHGNDKDYKGKYTHIYMGFGNGLSVDNNIYEEYKPYLDKEVNKYLDKCDENEQMKYAAIFNVWDKAFVNMADDKEYIIK